MDASRNSAYLSGPFPASTEAHPGMSRMAGQGPRARVDFMALIISKYLHSSPHSTIQQMNGGAGEHWVLQARMPP